MFHITSQGCCFSGGTPVAAWRRDPVSNLRIQVRFLFDVLFVFREKIFTCVCMCLCCVYLGYCHSCMCMFLALQRPQVSLHLEIYLTKSISIFISECCSRASMRHLTCRHRDMPGQPLVIDSKRSSRQLTSAKVSEGEQSNSTWSFPALQR